MSQRTILLQGGPLDKTIHELHMNFPVHKLALPDEDVLHWYIVSKDETTANYEMSEPLVKPLGE